MSFGVSDEAGDFEYSSGSANGLFAKRAHLATPWFHRMVADLLRFNREARELLRSEDDGPSLGRWLEERRYSRPFVDMLIVPQAAAVWSADPHQMWTFPARFLVEFFDNHGMLGFSDRPRWRTVQGGSHRYVQALLASSRARVRLRTPVTAIGRSDDHVAVSARGGEPERFDQIVLATHSDQALKMLSDPTDRERELLGAIPYQDQRGGPAHGRAFAPAPPPRLGELELPPTRAALGKVDRDLPHEPSAVVARGPRVLRDPQPHQRDRAREDHPHDSVRPSGLHRCRNCRSGDASPRSAGATGRITRARIGGGASTRTGSPARSGSPSISGWGRSRCGAGYMRDDPSSTILGASARVPSSHRDGLR